MPTTTAGLYEVTLEMTRFSQSIKSVFHFLATLGQDDEQDKIADAFDTTLMADLASLMDTPTNFDLIRVANLTGLLADTSIVPSQGNGDVIGLSMAPFIACSFRYVRTTKETRNGAKRFPGMIEENCVTGAFSAGYFSTMQTVATVLAGQIAATGIIAEPVILRKPDVAGVWTYNPVSNVVAIDRQTTQNSRKPF